MRYYLNAGQKLVSEVGYIELDKPTLEEQVKLLEDTIAGLK